MKKEKTDIIVTVVLLAIIILGVAAYLCIKNGVFDHKHKYNTQEILPTCTEEGYTLHKCKKCEDSYVDNIVQPTGHNYYIKSTISPTCIEKGKTIIGCQNCDFEKERITDSIGHVFGDDLICDNCGFEVLDHEHTFTKNVIEPKCTTLGYTLYVCDCGYSYRDDYIESTGHYFNNGTILKQSTCDSAGLIEYECILCQETYQYILEPSHVWNITIIQVHTCTTDGINKKECINCGIIEEEIIPAGHNFTSEIIVLNPTCTEEGYKEGYCSSCGKTIGEFIPKIPHEYIDGICVYCGKSMYDDVVNNSHIDYGYYFNFEDVLTMYGPDYIDEYGTYLDFNDDAVVQKVGVYLIQEGNYWKRAIACVGSNIKYATAVPYLANDKQIIYSGLNSEWIYIFNLNENEDGIWCYDNFATITSTLSDREGKRLLSLYNIGIAGNNTRIFDNLPEMIEWLKETECITHTEGKWIYDVLPTCEEDGLRHTECKRCKETIKEEIIEKLGHQISDDLTYNLTHHWYPLICGHSELEILIEHKIEYKNVLPTCADYGYDLYSCECGYNYKENYVDKLEHVIVFDMHQDSTCSQEGFDKYKCINCTYEYKNYISKIPHKYTMSVVEPTCEHEGYDLYKCHCGDSYKLNLVSRLPHKWEFDIEVQSTCTIQGYTRYMCSECRQTYYNYYEKLPHEYLKASIVQPTCHRQGYTKHTCECGHSYNDNYVNQLEHKWQFISSTESTCTKQGVDKYECSLCKDTQNHYKNKLPHNYIYEKVIDPTCSAQGYTKYTCECGHYIYDNYTNKLPHETYIDLDTDSTCTTKGKTVYKCENCSYSNTEYKQLLPHEYTSETYDPTCTENGYTKHTCECGYSYNSNIKTKLGHDYKELVLTNPTCENTGLNSYDCSRCDSYYEAATPALGHDLEEIEELPSCTVDGATLINCLRCDYQKIIPIPSTGHSYQKSIISPTCTEQGYTIYKCHCGSSYNSDYTSPKGHSTKTTTIIEPTCTTEGKSKTSCTKCSYSYETILSKTAHKYEQVTIQSTCTQEGYTAKQCSCGDKEILSIIPIKAHNTYVYSQKDSTCTEEGYTIRKCYNCDYYKTEIIERKAHSYKTTTIEPTCTEEGHVLKTCICGESYISEYLHKIPHSFKDDVCSMCGLYFYDQFVFESGELTIYNGESEYIEIPSYYYENGIKTKVTSVGTAFKENEKIKEIIIREGIEYISPNAFKGCISLEKVILPTSIKGIGSRAFMNCYSLEELNLPYGIESLDSHLVDNCEKLTNITIPSSVETLNSSAFVDCPNLTIYVPLSEPKETWYEEWYKNVKEVIWNSDNEYQITYDLDGGYYDIKVNKVIQEFTVNCYHTYVEGKISIVDKESPEFNYYIALEKMDVEGIYKINYVGEEIFSSYDLLIAWNDTVSDSALQEIWDFGAAYLATYVVMNLPSESSINADINVKIAQSIETPNIMPSYVKGNEFILPIPIKEGYNFLGWYNEDTKVEKITSDTTGNLELIAKWEKIIVEDEIIFNLNGGQLEVYTYDSFIENVIELFNASDEPGSKVVTKETFNSDSHPTIKGVYNKTENLEAHKWLFEFVKAEILALGVDHLYVKDTVEMLDKMIAGDTTAIGGSSYANGRVLLRHFIHNLINKNHEAVNSSFTKFVPDFTLEENQIKASKAMKNIKDVYQVGDQLPTAYKEGYKFLGWELNGQIITKANTELKGNLILIARYEDEKIEGNEILVGQTRTYKTLAEALAVANEGDIIILDAGSYDGTEITINNITINGANAGINPNREKRGAESVFLSDLIISANDVTIDGIQITGNARIMGGANGCENINIYNVWSKGATTNSTYDSNNAPFYFSSATPGVEYKNITLLKVRMSDREDRRQMVAYFNQVNGLTITDSSFIVRRANYNDAIKIGHQTGKQFGIKGSVNITGNHFENFQQYVIWLSDYQEGEYNFAYNTFRNVGETKDLHTAIRFGTYSGDINGISEINVHDNILDNSFLLIRLQSNSSRTAITQPVKVNYNLVVYHKSGYIINNENSYEIDCTNNMYDSVPDASQFINATWQPYLEIGGNYFNDNYGKIEYELNDGSFDTTPQMYYIKDLYALPTPTKEGSTFLGWYDNPYFTGEVISEVHSTGTITLYAKYGRE